MKKPRPPLKVCFRSLNGEEAGPHCIAVRGDVVTYIDGNGKPFLRVSMPEKNALLVEQLAPSLSLDGPSMEWAAKQMEKPL